MPDFVVCAGCSKQVAAGLTWCPFCGKALDAPAPLPGSIESAEDRDEDEDVDTAEVPAPTDTAEAPAPTDMARPEPSPIGGDPIATRCTSCGHSIDPRLTWCPFCGVRHAPAGAAERSEVPEPPEEAEPSEPATIEPIAPEPAVDATVSAEPTPGDEAPEDGGPDSLPPRPRRTDRPLGVDASGHAPDLDREIRRIRRRRNAGMVMSIILILGSVAFVAVLLALLLGSGDDDESTEGAAALPEAVFAAFEPQTGDCLGYRTDGEITQEPCTSSHDGEVFAVTRYLPTTAEYPGSEAVGEFASERCLLQFQAYVGVSYFGSGLTFTTIGPSDGGWADGDRRILCVLENPLGEPLTTTAHASQGLTHAGYVPFALLSAGSCWDFAGDLGELVPVVDCDAPHDAETFAAYDFPASQFPGDGEAQRIGDEGCERLFNTYVGVPPPAGMDWYAATPVEFEWQHGYRAVICTLFRADGVKLTASAAA